MEQAVELYIKELVLHGFPSMDGDRIREAVQRRLANLLTSGGVPSSLTRAGHAAEVDAGTFKSAPGAGEDTVGSRIAQHLYSTFSRSTPSKGESLP